MIKELIHRLRGRVTWQCRNCGHKIVFAGEAGFMHATPGWFARVVSVPCMATPECRCTKPQIGHEDAQE